MNIVRFFKNGRRGFTLIELLAVIAVIGILAAIIIPVTASVRRKARETSGSSNLRQIAMSCLLIAEEERGLLPASWEDDATQKNYLYGASRRLFANADPDCLSWWRYEALNDPLADDRTDDRAMPDFSAHPRLMPDTVRTGSRFRLSDVRRPSEVFLLFDASINPTGRSYYTGRWLPNWEEPLGEDADAIVSFPPDDSEGTIGWRLSGGQAARAAFSDGHIAIIRRDGVKKRNIQLER